MARVRIPTVLRKFTAGEAIVTVDGATVGEAFRALVAADDEFARQIFDGEELRGYINVYVDDEDIRYLDGLDTPVGAEDEIAIMPAVAGGAA
ncbi:MAG: ubiquitin-like small modifier protein 1 [Nitriliruptoraceae bacterium]